MAPPKEWTIARVTRRIKDNAKKTGPKMEDILWMEANTPGHFRQLAIDPELKGSMVRALGRELAICSEELGGKLRDKELKKEATDGFQWPAGVAKRKAHSKAPGKPAGKRIPTNREDSESGEEDEPAATPPVKRARLLNTLIPEDMREFAEKIDDTFKPQPFGKDEVIVGLWKTDPEPLRMVAARIDSSGNVAYVIRNFTRTGQGLEPNDDYTAHADRPTLLAFTEAKARIRWNAKAVEAKANESLERLVHHICRVLFAREAKNEKGNPIVPWANADDVLANPVLGRIYKFCVTPTRYEWTNALENMATETMRPLQLETMAKARLGEIDKAIGAWRASLTAKDATGESVRTKARFASVAVWEAVKHLLKDLLEVRAMYDLEEALDHTKIAPELLRELNWQPGTDNFGPYVREAPSVAAGEAPEVEHSDEPGNGDAEATEAADANK
ncbi:hypothetical protein PV04_09771 [Phialophora macrospora]|uniref:Uncharacterized protein n=1 Tax=Phialophora macrospora TaxID=1851006 RepID=A0A0D2FS57_9EURO|nr:hypothetical protein PV04_09771 [Phialophora macrospora]